MKTAAAISMVQRSAEYVCRLLSEDLPPGMAYHNLDHTLQVVRAAQEIGQAEGLSRDALEMVTIAAWFHDTGFVRAYEGHEIAGARIARQFLKTSGYPKDKIEIIEDCIRSTQCGVSPVTHLEKVLCDADLYHLSGKHYSEMAQRLKQEWARYGKRYTDSEWDAENTQFLASHTYHTAYGKSHLRSGKLENLGKLTARVLTPEE